jgi:DNA primase
MFEKSKLLYGMHAAKQEIRKTETAILVEGYMDVLALHQAGITNAVASCGTALTRHQAKIMQRYTSRVLFIYDADPAGRKSMMSGIDILLSEGIVPYVVMLPHGDDPDSFVRREGREAFMRYTEENRLGFLDFQIRFFTESGDFDQPDTKAKAISAMGRTIALIPDRVRRELYMQELSGKLSISMQALRESAGKERAVKEPYTSKEERTATAQFRTQDTRSRVTILEKTFLKALLESALYGNGVIEFG